MLPQPCFIWRHAASGFRAYQRWQRELERHPVVFQREHNWEIVRRACHKLVREANERICALAPLYPPISEFGPGGFHEGVQMVSAPLPADTDMTALKTRLYDDYRIEIPLFLWNGRKLDRVSVQGYNNRRDVEMLVEALVKLGSKHE